MNSKLLIFLGVLCFTISFAKGQSIKEYFIPDAPNNKATSTISDERIRLKGNFKIIYFDKKNQFYVLHEKEWHNGSMEMKSDITYKITNDEVIEMQCVFTDEFSKNKLVIYEPKRIILKIPPEGKTIKWVINWSGKNDKYQSNTLCTASWTSVVINNEIKKTIKVIKREKQYNNMITSDYYVKGYGLWKTVNSSYFESWSLTKEKYLK